ncbi:MAG TPA: ABC transporter ATP-binding protein [Methylomirabilota bacterium]|nr:ABC transporter ATP-binding protein [Methylomirabilota bacterium]
MIRVEQLNVRAGAFSLHNVSFEIVAGEYAVLMGRTGSGKTTLLETICGLRRAVAGRISLNGRDVTERSPGERGIGYVPQDRALFLTMTVRENLGFGLRVRGDETSAIQARVENLAASLGITPLLDRKPHALSGGEAQRVALGRALALAPGVLCLDEPLSGLDDDTRGEMHSLLRAIHAQTRATILHVTHHIADAQQLATKLLRLQDGGVREEPAPLK